MIQLPNVTLFATTPAPLQDLQLRSFNLCRAAAQFGDEIMFAETNTLQPWTVVIIEPCGGNQASGVHYIKNLPKRLKTSHVLVIDWDSWIIDADMWTDEFLQYDYIGARWPWQPEGRNIGNSGFVLYSKRMLEAMAAMPDFETNECMDAHLGTVWRPILEERGFKFPSSEVADRFSYEHVQPAPHSFGFHALFNFWRHVDDGEIPSIVSMMPDYVVKRNEYKELMNSYLSISKFKPYQAMVKRLDEAVTR